MPIGPWQDFRSKTLDKTSALPIIPPDMISLVQFQDFPIKRLGAHLLFSF